jgi:hypothetical protein
MRLTYQEADLLINHLDMVLQDMSETWNEMVEDKATFKTPEEFLETLGQHEADTEVLRDIKRKVEHERRLRGDRPSLVRALRARVQGNAG